MYKYLYRCDIWCVLPFEYVHVNGIKTRRRLVESGNEEEKDAIWINKVEADRWREVLRLYFPVHNENVTKRRMYV